ncbi:glutathione S-transferase omega-1-like [Bombina bombina]|uniref:glutathione S-transferase omega-1-like n=1 Tax=Bombina bombina TaxID=8345 RepID=UPI00235AC7DA|nr:glutathione S-transferase omega-1-like [Bombina bombina]
MAGTQKSLGKGSPAPGPVPDGSIRVYSMRFCPFAQRARLVLAAKGINHELVNINTKNKPEWFVEKNPFGVVPVLETSKGQLIYESAIVCEYLDEAFPGKKLNPKDPFQRAQQKMILEHFSKIIMVLYKILYAKQNKEDIPGLKAEVKEKLIALDELLGQLNTSFFGGDSVSMIDYLIWPWFERFIIFDVKECLNKTSRLNEWYQRMLQDTAVKATFTEPDLHQAFIKLYLKDSVDAADYGL